MELGLSTLDIQLAGLSAVSVSGLGTLGAVSFCTTVSVRKFLGNVFSQIPRCSNGAIQKLEERSQSWPRLFPHLVPAVGTSTSRCGRQHGLPGAAGPADCVPGGTRPTSRRLGQLQKRPQAWQPPCSCLMGPGRASPWPGRGHRGPLLPIVPPGPHFQVPGATLQEPRVGWRAKSQVVCDAKAWGPGRVQSIQAAPHVVYARPFFRPGRGCPYVLGAPRLWTREGRQLASKEKCRPSSLRGSGAGLVWAERAITGVSLSAGRGWPRWT